MYWYYKDIIIENYKKWVASVGIKGVLHWEKIRYAVV